MRRAKAGAVESVIVEGEVIYHEGQFTRIDRAGVLADIAMQRAQPRSEVEATRHKLAEALLPHMRAFYTARETD
ncbi:MAG: hypothetical protein ACXIUW_02615 [Roseinatronobacter sp.]